MADLRVNVKIQGDASDAKAAFADVGDGARKMAAEVDQQTDKARGGLSRLDDGVGGSEAKFRGFGDVVGGTGDVMEGFRSGNLLQMSMGMADLAGGISSLVIPALQSLSAFLSTQLTAAMTLISAHPLVAAILVGGAIIVGLVLLEKKFGLVSTAVHAVGDAIQAVWEFIQPILKSMADAIGKVAKPLESVINAGKSVIGGVTGAGKSVLSTLNPFGHTGGIVPGVAGQDVPMTLQAGELIVPRGQHGGGMGGGLTVIVQGSVITERDLGRIIADAQRNNRLIGVAP